MKRDVIRDVLRRADPGAGVTVCGWVKTRRDSKGGFSFLAINDGSCLDNIQVVADEGLANYETEIRHLSTGCSVRVRGRIVESPGTGQAVEVHADAVDVLGHADPEAYPLQKKKISLERLREIAHLRPRTNTFGAVTRIRSELAFATHNFFRENGFHHVHTPIITASDCEGAGEMFRVIGAGDSPQDFFSKPTFLTVSGQLEGEAYA
ncbi:MAG: asparagine--tRNA ligase, partial [Lentisphaerae bacterium]|nr:asparagine--tRNA ligase [Lentisphaerota bacterium]